MKRTSYIMVLALMLLLAGCEHINLLDESPCDISRARDQVVRIVHHWEDAIATTIPAKMRVDWYRHEDGKATFSADYKSTVDYDKLGTAVYNPLCYDYWENRSIGIRTTDWRHEFELYNFPQSGTYYNYFVPQLPDERTVKEANPYHFYVTRQEHKVDTSQNQDTITVDLYPKNVLREYTFLIYGIDGKYIKHLSGAISGMSASYFPTGDRLASEESTVFFTRLVLHSNGQHSDHQITGKFSTFGPVTENLLNGHFRIVIGALNAGKEYSYGAWGFAGGAWEDNVGSQIQGSWGQNGTPEEQLAWRERNGGFDIILNNDGRLVVPEPDSGGEPPTGGGGFEIDDDEWVSVPVPLDP